MSHTQEVKVEMKDLTLLKKAAQNINATVKEGQHTLYQGSYSGTGIYLKGWKYPVVIEADGTCKYDNYKGSWGNIEEFNKLKQQYSLEAVQKQLKANKMKASISVSEDGKISLKVRLAV